MPNNGANPLTNAKLFAVKETTTGTFKKPATADTLYQASYGTLKLGRSYTASEEIKPSLNISDRIQNKPGAGEFGFDMYFRPDGVDATTDLVKVPMGADLFECLFGKVQSFNAQVGAGGITNSVGSIPFNTFTGDKPPAIGVIQVNNGANKELIYYTGITWTNATSGTFTGCTRAYGATTAAAATATDAIVDGSKTYRQKIDRPSLSLIRQFDFLMEAAKGCVPTQMSVNLSNQGYAKMSISGGCMDVGRAGQSSLSGTATGVAVITLQTGEAKNYRVLGLVQNTTQADDNTGAGWQITAVDYTTDKLTLEANVTGWSTNDAIEAFTPAETAKGSALNNENLQITIGGIVKTPESFDFTYSAPVKYNEEIISPNPPDEYYPEKREVTGSYGSIFKNSEIKEFYNADKDVKTSVLIRIGDGTAGKTVLIWMPNCSINVPEMDITEPVIKSKINFTALNTSGNVEDSCFLIFV